jgi:hypothetical protein
MHDRAPQPCRQLCLQSRPQSCHPEAAIWPKDLSANHLDRIAGSMSRGSIE